VLLTPSRENFVAALRDFNEDWLNECGGYGAVSQVLSRVDVLSVSSMVHSNATHKLKRLPTQLPAHSGPGLVISLDAEGGTT